MTQRGTHGRWRNLWWEALIGILVVFGLAWVGFRAATPQGGWILNAISGRWAMVAVSVVTGVVVVVHLYWTLRRLVAFWLMALAFIAALAATAYAWFPTGASGAAGRTILFGPIGGAEFVPFAYAVYRRFHVLPKQRG